MVISPVVDETFERPEKRGAWYDRAAGMASGPTCREITRHSGKGEVGNKEIVGSGARGAFSGGLHVIMMYHQNHQQQVSGNAY